MEPGLGARRIAGGERDVRVMRVLGALCAPSHRVSYVAKRISSSRWYGSSVAYSLAPYLSVTQSRGIKAKLDAHWGWLESRLGCMQGIQSTYAHVQSAYTHSRECEGHHRTGEGASPRSPLDTGKREYGERKGSQPCGDTDLAKERSSSSRGACLGEWQRAVGRGEGSTRTSSKGSPCRKNAPSGPVGLWHARVDVRLVACGGRDLCL